jgi:L-threonylcarbamoyladenylate synthase
MPLSQIDECIVAKAARIIRKGGIVVYPTETVYGMAANPFSRKAVMKIFKAKRRPLGSPLTVAVNRIGEASKFGFVSKRARILAKAFLPGPLTIVIRKRPGLPKELTAGMDTIGIRVPDNDVARRLIELAGPITATSANISGQHSPSTADDAKAQLRGRVDMVIGCGKCKVGKESTIVDVSVKGKFRVLREGAISQKSIERVLESSGKP